RPAGVALVSERTAPAGAAAADKLPGRDADEKGDAARRDQLARLRVDGGVGADGAIRRRQRARQHGGAVLRPARAAPHQLRPTAARPDRLAPPMCLLHCYPCLFTRQRSSIRGYDLLALRAASKGLLSLEPPEGVAKT